MVDLFLNPSSELPIYRQIMRQIVEAIASGRLKGGDKLLSHRELGERMVVAPLTVKKAYDELEAQGFIETQRGRGTFVCESIPEPEDNDDVVKAARHLLTTARLAGIGFAETVQILKAAERDLSLGPKRRAEEQGKASEE